MADEKKKAETEEEEAKPVGETVPGGAYKIGGKMVDSEGQEIGKKKDDAKK